MDEIGDLVNRVLRGSEMVMASPETICRLKESSDQLEEIKSLPLEAALDKLFEIRRQQSGVIARQIPGSPSWELPIQALYDEIRQCALFGLNGAAITLCGILVEFVMKYAVFFRQHGAKIKFDSEAWEEYENFTFASAIDRAKQSKLIDDRQEQALMDFKDEVRNP
jgi:hypothetical protein